jgi:predicted nucleic acid-binding protein
VIPEGTHRLAVLAAITSTLAACTTSRRDRRGALRPEGRFARAALSPDQRWGAFVRFDQHLTNQDITLGHAATASALPRHHRDPFDRMLIGQAMADGLTMVTSDPAFKRYRGLRHLDA